MHLFCSFFASITHLYYFDLQNLGSTEISKKMVDHNFTDGTYEDNSSSAGIQTLKMELIPE